MISGSEYFMAVELKEGYFKAIGTDFDHMLAPVSHFGDKRKTIKDRVAKKLTLFYEKYFDIF